MSNWIYMNKEVTKLEDFPNHDCAIGFVYRITHIESGKFYIGKKVLEFSKRTAISLREKKATGTRKKTKIVCKPSNWLDYWGSCKELTTEIKLIGKDKFKREILELCFNKRYLHFCELEHQIKRNVLRVNSYNANILGRYFIKDMKNCKHE